MLPTFFLEFDFTGRFSINGHGGRISMPQGCFRLAHLPLLAQGNQPGRLHHPACRNAGLDGRSCACPLTETLAEAARAGSGSWAARMRRALRRKAAGGQNVALDPRDDVYIPLSLLISLPYHHRPTFENLSFKETSNHPLGTPILK
jgi:hypothetical protein